MPIGKPDGFLSICGDRLQANKEWVELDGVAIVKPSFKGMIATNDHCFFTASSKGEVEVEFPADWTAAFGAAVVR